MTDDKQALKAELEAAALAAKIEKQREWGRDAVARPDPILFLMRLPREVVRNAIVDRFCDEMNYIQGEARRATASE